MLLYSNIVVTRGGFRGPAAWASEVHAHVNSKVANDIGLYVGGAGYPMTTFIYSGVFESMAAIQDLNLVLMGDTAYHDLVEKGSEFWTAPPETRLRQLLHMAPTDPQPIQPGAVVSVFSATPRGKRFMAAMEFGVEITGYIQKHSGVPVAFLRNVAGDAADVSWIAVYENAAAVDKGIEFESTDDGYLKRFAAGGGLFVDHSAKRGFMTRVA